MDAPLLIARFGSKLVLTINNDDSSPSVVFECDSSSECTVNTESVPLSGADHVYPNEIHTIIGIINLLAGPYVIVATKIAKVGQIQGKEVFRIDAGMCKW